MSELTLVLLSALVSFLVAWVTVRAEESKGRAAMYGLCCRYFISAFNSIDRASGELKQDPLTKKQYVNELMAIVTELSALSQNPFFSKFIARNRYAPKMLVQLRRELTEHDLASNFALNEGSISDLIQTFSWCTKQPWGFLLAKQEEHQQLVDFFKTWGRGD